MKARFTLQMFALCAIAFFITFQSSFAQSGATLSIQGIIQKSNGAAVDDGKYNLTFKLYSTASGGTPVHTESQDVTVTGGIYSTELGGGSTPLTAAFDQTYYLGVSVDGGAELIPRARLTSSPYSLALLGKSNLFPSSGAIGAGTVTPVAGYQLHIKNDSGAGKALLEGSTAAQIDLKKGSTIGAIGFGTSNNDFVVNPGANNTTLQYNGSTKLTVNTNGVDVAGTLNAGTLTATNFSPSSMSITSKLAVGQSGVDANNAFRVSGTSFFSGFVEVNGSAKNYNIGQVTFYNNNTGNNLVTIQTGNQDIAMRVAGRLNASEFWASSDQRIKKDFNLSESQKDLAILRSLKVTNYRHIDVLDKGNSYKKGFVAQEVKGVFAEAVTTAPDFIPNIYALSTHTQLQGEKLMVTLDKIHDLKIGDELKLMLPEGEKKVLVTARNSDYAFTTNWSGPAPTNKVFVYGKKVEDFHTVDYDRIFTLNVSATQELARQVEELKQQNALLKSELSNTKSENQHLKASAEKFDARLRALEAKLSN